MIDTKTLSKNKREQIKKQLDHNYVPCLAVILVGENPASLSYVKGKEKACREVGISTITITLEDRITQEELIKLIDELNIDDGVDGILIQLPLPSHIDEFAVINAIDPSKDVDGFHPSNVAALYLKQKGIIPCTPKGIIDVLDFAGIEIEGKYAVVIGRSNIVGMPISKLLLDRNATVTICHSKTKNLSEITSKADILIAAVGKPLFVTADMVKEGAVVIDVGVNRGENGKLCGDVDFENVKEKTSYITKVPGGIGPMTITCLLENTVECFMNRKVLKNEC